MAHLRKQTCQNLPFSPPHRASFALPLPPHPQLSLRIPRLEPAAVQAFKSTGEASVTASSWVAVAEEEPLPGSA